MSLGRGKTTLGAKIAGYNESQRAQVQKLYEYELKRGAEGITPGAPDPIPEPAWLGQELVMGRDTIPLGTLVGPNGLGMYRRQYEPYAADRSIRAGTYVTYTRTGAGIQGAIDAVEPKNSAERSAGKRGARKAWGSSVFAGRRYIARDPNAIDEAQWGKFAARWINPDEKSSVFLRMTQILMPTGIVMDVCGTPQSTILSALTFLKGVMGKLPRDREFSVWPLRVTGTPYAEIDQAMVFYKHFKS